MPELTGFAVAHNAVAQNQDGGLEIVAVARGLPDWGEEPFSAVWSAPQGPGTADWSRRSLGGPPSGVAGGIAIAPNHDGRLESAVVAAGDPANPGGAVWHAWQTRPGGDWSSWQPLATPPGGASLIGTVLAQDHEGRLEVFTRTFDGKVWHRRQAQPGRGPWEHWQSLDSPAHPGGFMPPPAVVRNHRGRLEVFTVAMGGLWHRWQTTASGDDWSDWTPFESPGGGMGIDSPMLVRSTDGWLGAVTIASDRSIWRRRRRPGGEWDQWMPFQSHPGWLTGLAAGTQPDGGLVLFAISRRPDHTTELWLGQVPGPDWQVVQWTLRDTGPELGIGVAAGGTFKSPALVSDSQGRLRLFCQVTATKTPDRQTFLYMLSQQDPNGDQWKGDQLFDLARLHQGGQTG
jgi:hypothetical protein